MTYLELQLQKWTEESKKKTFTSLAETSSSTEHSKSGKQAGKVTLKGTAGTEAPVYVMFWTNPHTLELIAGSLASDVSTQLPFGPSSTVLLEVTEEAGMLSLTSNLFVRLLINDEEAKTSLCGTSAAAKCELGTFIDNLNKASKVSDVDKYCKA